MEPNFGKEMRKLRVLKGLTLEELGKKLKKSAAFLSGIETGRRPVPAVLVDELKEALNLNQHNVAKLEGLARATRSKTVVIGLENKDEFTQRLVVAFARRIDGLSQKDQKTLMEFFDKKM